MILKLSYAHIALLILPLIPLLPQVFFFVRAHLLPLPFIPLLPQGVSAGCTSSRHSLAPAVQPFPALPRSVLPNSCTRASWNQLKYSQSFQDLERVLLEFEKQIPIIKDAAQVKHMCMCEVVHFLFMPVST